MFLPVPRARDCLAAGTPVRKRSVRSKWHGSGGKIPGTNCVPHRKNVLSEELKAAGKHLDELRVRAVGMLFEGLGSQPEKKIREGTKPTSTST